MQKIIPPILMLICGAGMMALHLTWPVHTMEHPATWIVGGGLMVLGLGIAVVARIQFRRAATNIWTFGTPTRLVTGGVFAWSRNPMYVGFALIVFGWAVGLGSVTPFLGWLAFMAACALWYIPFEEARMTETFGDAFTAYTSRTRRWI